MEYELFLKFFSPRSKLVPPRWIREPQDTALMLGNAIVIHCEAEGYPEPEITWLKGGKKEYIVVFEFVQYKHIVNFKIHICI